MDYSKQKEIEKFRSKKLNYYMSLAKNPQKLDENLEKIKKLKKIRKDLEKEIEILEEKLEEKNLKLDKIFNEIDRLKHKESES